MICIVLIVVEVLANDRKKYQNNNATVIMTRKKYVAETLQGTRTDAQNNVHQSKIAHVPQKKLIETVMHNNNK